MRRPSVYKQICYWVLTLALFAVRSADAHVHMCLDGQEPPASVHVADGGVHHNDATASPTHNDQDVKVVSDAGVKKGESADLWVLSTAWSLVDQLAYFTAEPPQCTAVAVNLSIRSHLRPPLRGPPL